MIAKPLYDLRDRSLPRLFATEYPLKDEVTDLFPVPRTCSVGTNSLRNGVTLLGLCGEKVQYDAVVRDFAREASAGRMSFLPGFAEDTIAYAKARTFFVVQLVKRDVQRFKLAPILEYTIDDVAVIDWGKRLFAVSLRFTQSSGAATEVQVVDLSGAGVRILAEREIKDEPRWARLGRTTFFFAKTGESLRLHALDERLRETFHPLVSLFANRDMPARLELPLVHPSLPFAVFASLEHLPDPRVAVWIARWSAGDAEAQAVRLSNSESGDFRFSPDGKWLLFLDGTTGPDRLMVMPVDPTLPYYLGPPMVLQTTEKIEGLGSNCAWITDPPAVVCTINRTEHVSTTGEERPVNKLLKWELPSRGPHR